jgi:hypothetical protein
MKSKSVICAQVTIDVMGPADASRKRIRFVVGILRGCLCTLSKDFRVSHIPQMKGFSLKPAPLTRRKGKYGKK